MRRYRSILSERGFLSHAAMGGFATFAFFGYLAGSSPVFIQGFGLTPLQYAMIFGGNSFGLICCAQLNPLLLRRFGHDRVLRMVARVHLAATATLTAIAFAGLHVLPLVIAPIFVAISCMGMLNPNTIVGALARHAQHAGSASAVMGTGQYPAGRGQRPAGGAAHRRHAARHGGADAGRIDRHGDGGSAPPRLAAPEKRRQEEQGCRKACTPVARTQIVRRRSRRPCDGGGYARGQEKNSPLRRRER